MIKLAYVKSTSENIAVKSIEWIIAHYVSLQFEFRVAFLSEQLFEKYFLKMIL